MARPHLANHPRRHRRPRPGRWDRPRPRRDHRRAPVPIPYPGLLRLLVLLALISLTWRLP